MQKVDRNDLCYVTLPAEAPTMTAIKNSAVRDIRMLSYMH